MNPFGQVPVLEDGDTVVADANAILVYLAMRYDAGGSWLPRARASSGGAAMALRSCQRAHTHGPALARVGRLFGGSVDRARVELLAGRLFGAMEATLAERTFLVGSAPTVADLALYGYTARANEGRSHRPVPPHRAVARAFGSAPRLRADAEGCVSDEPFHDGETYVQARAQVREMAALIGPRMIRDFMPEQHRQFFERLRYAVVGTVDDHGAPWASLLTGAPGFLRTPDARTVELDLAPPEGDGVRARALPGRRIALLGIELSTRRRNRMNGTVVSETDGTLTVHVDQSFGNCPKYIQARDVWARGDLPQSSRRDEGPRLSAEAQQLVAGADTFFIASSTPAQGSSDPREGVDVSHRGGAPGFVDVRDEGAELWVPRLLRRRSAERLSRAIRRWGSVSWTSRRGRCCSSRKTAGDRVGCAAGGAVSPGRAHSACDVVGGQLLHGAVPLGWSTPGSPQLAATTVAPNRREHRVDSGRGICWRFMKPASPRSEKAIRAASAQRSAEALGPRPRRGAPDETRSRLLASAAEEFEQHGYFGTDSNRIARAAGYAPGTFYKHFVDKRTAFLAVYEAWIAREWDGVAALARSGRVEDLAARIGEHVIAQHREWSGFRASLRALVVLEPDIRRAHRASRGRQLAMMERLGLHGRAENAALLLAVERIADAIADGELEALGVSEEDARAQLVAHIAARLASR